MADVELINLINAEIDGELEAPQRAELARRLLADPEARALREDLLRVRTMLDAVAEVEPPPELRANVLRGLPAADARGSRASWVAARWRYGALAAGVMAAAVLVYETVDGP